MTALVGENESGGGVRRIKPLEPLALKLVVVTLSVEPSEDGMLGADRRGHNRINCLLHSFSI